MIISGKSFLYRLQNRRDLYLSLEDLPRIKIIQDFFPLNSQIFWIFINRTCITNVLNTNQNECKGSSKWGCSVLHENLNSESEHVESRIPNLCLRHRCVHTEGFTTSQPHPQHCCRFSADLPSTCHMLLRPSHETSSLVPSNWKEHRVLVPRPLVEILWTVNPGGEF